MSDQLEIPAFLRRPKVAPQVAAEPEPVTFHYLTDEQLQRRMEQYPYLYLVPTCLSYNTETVVRLFKSDRQAASIYTRDILGNLIKGVEDIAAVDHKLLTQIFNEICEQRGVDPERFNGDPPHKLYRLCYMVGDPVNYGLGLQSKNRAKHLYEINVKKLEATRDRWRYPRQAKIMLEMLLSFNDKMVTEEELQKAVLHLLATGKLKTQQDAWRIFQYYRPQFIKDGYLLRGGGAFEADEEAGN